MSALRTGRSRHAHRSRGPRGVSLIELLAVLLAIGILAGIAVPAYRAQLLRTNRTEGRAALLALAVAQEKFYLECHRYAMELDPAQAPGVRPSDRPPALVARLVHGAVAARALGATIADLARRGQVKALRGPVNE